MAGWFSAAQIRAKAIASLLRGAHEKFTELRKKLESARDDAIAAGMTVSEQGQVTFDHAKLTPAERSAYHHDPDGEAAMRTAVTKWQNHGHRGGGIAVGRITARWTGTGYPHRAGPLPYPRPAPMAPTR
ncbi:hypothetical protein [Streptomyces sp. NPDC049949]|uniref:hypothetical protein n=1 Tax=Streptomyces sp. NPDC049949 TaxID=3154627 RepID=UPI003437980D